jgi:hypothetical protein
MTGRCSAVAVNVIAGWLICQTDSIRIGSETSRLISRGPGCWRVRFNSIYFHLYCPRGTPL